MTPESWFQTVGAALLSNFFSKVESAYREGIQRGLRPKVDAGAILETLRGDISISGGGRYE